VLGGVPWRLQHRGNHDADLGHLDLWSSQGHMPSLSAKPHGPLQCGPGLTMPTVRELHCAQEQM
jgi:hypothetical protein